MKRSKLRRAVPVLIALAVLAGVVWAVVVLTADEADTGDELVIVIDEVERLTLTDTVVLRGQVGREERFTVMASGSGRVTSVSVAADDLVETGDELLRLNGRPMLAVDPVDGADPVPYWRPLARFVEDGPDVTALEQFLSDSGYSPGTINQEFTDRTADAVEAWQEDNGYPVDGRFLPTDVAPGAWPATIGSIELDPGTSVTSGQPLLILVEEDLTVGVDVDPTDRSRLSADLTAVVSVPATGAEGTGTIVELADNAVVDEQGVERYRGEISLDGDLGVVEGTAVRVEVILDRVTDALAVPVAAVSLGSNGDEEVRILNREGTIDRVGVVTGLTEGAMVQVVEGLDGSEQVVVEVREE